jgi:hypothetical protein
MKSSLEHKTVRPGSLAEYSFYYSKRRTAPVPPAVSPRKQRRLPFKVLAILLVLVVGGISFGLTQRSDSAGTLASGSSQQPPASKVPVVSAPKTSPPAQAAVNHCAGNTVGQLVKISINQRHLWACAADKQLYDAPVITGMEKYAATETPLGTYKVYAKQINVTLTGSDETGSWKDPVYYWMPFMDNQYGTYGFHDATWRTDNEFGNIDANTSADASHGCIELPLAASKWLYNWAQVGTSVTVET